MAKGKVKKDKKGKDEQLARAIADYQNLVRRIEKEKEAFRLRASRSLIEDLLPVLDDLERVQEHLNDQGLEMALSQLKKVLFSHGVEEIPVKPGDSFDSRIHEAIDAVSGGRNGTIAKILLKGYHWNDGTIVRPVKVQVYGEKPDKEEELNEELTRGDYV